MIISAEHIHVPESGRYEEVIFDIDSTWNSQKWTWLKFMNDDYSEWCGEFRGEYRGHGISEKYGVIYVLTTDYLFQLDMLKHTIDKYEDRPEYNELEVSPDGDYIVSSYYHISILDSQGQQKKVIETSMPLDMITFLKWKGKDLVIHADELMNWDNHIVMTLNSKTWEVEIISQTKPGIR